MTLHTKLRDSGDVRILDVEGRATLGAGSELLDQQLREIVEGGWSKLIVNLSEAIQVDSSGIGSLARTSFSLARRGGALKLVCPAGRVREVLNVMRLTNVIPTFDDEPSAIRSFR